MGRAPARPRTPMQSIGAIGSTTLAPAPNGGGHDALLQRLIGQGGTEWANPTMGKVIAYAPDPVPITGAGSFVINEFLVDDKWDEGRPCLVTATVAYQGNYTPVRATEEPDPVTWLRPPMLTMTILDGDANRATPDVAPAEYEYATAAWPVAELYANASYSHTIETRSWLFVRGRPKLVATCLVDSAAAAGLSGSPELVAIARITPL